MSSNFRCLFVFFGVFFTFFDFSTSTCFYATTTEQQKPSRVSALLFLLFLSGGFSFCLQRKNDAREKRRPRKTNAVCLSFGFNYASFFFVKRMIAIAATATNAMMPMVQPTAAPQPAFSVLSATEISYVAVAPL